MTVIMMSVQVMKFVLIAYFQVLLERQRKIREEEERRAAAAAKVHFTAVTSPFPHIVPT